MVRVKEIKTITPETIANEGLPTESYYKWIYENFKIGGENDKDKIDLRFYSINFNSSYC